MTGCCTRQLSQPRKIIIEVIIIIIVIIMIMIIIIIIIMIIIIIIIILASLSLLIISRRAGQVSVWRLAPGLLRSLRARLADDMSDDNSTTTNNTNKCINSY